MGTDRLAECPVVAPDICAAQYIDPHWQRQRIDWVRTNATLSVGLGRGWQATLGVPFDVKIFSVYYETFEGDPFDPPYGDIHHRDEVLWGLADGQALVWRYGELIPRVVLGVGAGVSLPFGRTYDDPFFAASQGDEHQHYQHGTGTFNPLVSVSATFVGVRWGGSGSADLRIPVYANQRGYQAPLSVSASLGPSFKIVPQLTVILTGDYRFTAQEFWDDAPYGGRQAVMLTGGVLVQAAPGVVFQGFVKGTLWQQALAGPDAELLDQTVQASVGVSWIPRRPKR